MIETDVIEQVQSRLKELLLNEKIINYRDHEFFHSKTNQRYQFLIWKIQPENVEEFGKKIQRLIEIEKYECIPGAWDVSTYNPEKQTGYKVVALYKS